MSSLLVIVMAHHQVHLANENASPALEELFASSRYLTNNSWMDAKLLTWPVSTLYIITHHAGTYSSIQLSKAVRNVYIIRFLTYTHKEAG